MLHQKVHEIVLRKRVLIKIEPNGTDSDYAVATLSVILLYLCKRIWTWIFHCFLLLRYHSFPFQHVIKVATLSVIGLYLCKRIWLSDFSSMFYVWVSLLVELFVFTAVKVEFLNEFLNLSFLICMIFIIISTWFLLISISKFQNLVIW